MCPTLARTPRGAPEVLAGVQGQEDVDTMFDGGDYSWLRDTARVIRAVQARWPATGSRRNALTALMHLCEVKCGEFNSTFSAVHGAEEDIGGDVGDHDTSANAVISSGGGASKAHAWWRQLTTRPA